MTEHDDLDAAIASEFDAYRPVARDLFPTPPTATVFTRARRGTALRRGATVLATAAAVVLIVAALLLLRVDPSGPPPPPGMTPSSEAVPSASATDGPSPTPSSSHSGR